MGAALSMALSLKSQDQQYHEEPDDDEELDDPMEDIEPDDEISQQTVTKSQKTKSSEKTLPRNHFGIFDIVGMEATVIKQPTISCQ